jgi:hypothetical protein
MLTARTVENQNESFSLLLPNLFIGLCKGARNLGDYSRIFKEELGYLIFKFEPSFKTFVAGRINPDVIIISNNVENTLIIEWTESSHVNEDKKRQIDRYSRLSRDDLINIVAIPINSAKTHDIILITLPNSVSSYSEYMKLRNLRFPILDFTIQESNYCLEKKENDFEESRTNKFFTDGIKIQRIPLHYIPIPLDNFSSKSIVTLVIGHLVSLLIKGVQEFSIGEFCEGYISAWDFIDIKKQSKLMKATTGLLNELARRPIVNQIIARIGDNPPKWKIKDEIDIRKKMKSIQKALNSFIVDIKEDRPYQLEMNI